MASIVYNNYKEAALNGDIDLTNDTIKLALLTSTYTPDIDADANWSDISADEVANSGTYAQDGATLTVTVSQDDTNDRGKFDATDVAFTSATITARYAAIYKSTGTESTSTLICLIDFAADKSSTAGTFTIAFHADGIMYLS